MAEPELRRIRPQLVNSCNEAVLKGLIDDLLHEGVLIDAEKEFIIEGSSLRADKCRSLIDTILKKGEYSCKLLLAKLTEKDPKLSEVLMITAKLPLPTQEQPNQSANASPAQEQAKQPEINGLILCSKAEYQKITTTEIERYPIYEKSTRKRWALIICNITFNNENIKERKGADVDLKEMKILLEGLHYNVQCEKNLTAKDMRSTMKTFAADTDHSKSDSTFLVFMSHGERNIIYGIDFKRENVNGKEMVTGDLHVDEIINIFNNKSCPGLRDKPKMIIIQACRGHDRSRVLVSDGAQEPPSIKQEDLEDDGARPMQKELDFICFYSTTPDTVSFRHPTEGSLFIQSLITFMRQYAHNSSIEEIFRKVRLSFKDRDQMPTLERTTLVYTFFLLPGY